MPTIHPPSMRGIAMKKVNNHDARAYIADRRPFESHTGNFRGMEHAPGSYVYTGYLPRAYAQRGRIQDADYIVFSYSTPIAWHLPDGWVVPDVSYSTTTSSQHQSRLYGLGEKSASHLLAPWELGLGKTSARILRAIRSGYSVDQGSRRRSTLQAVVDTGEARWTEDATSVRWSRTIEPSR